MIALTRALLAAGAQCVLVALWPVPNTAVKVLMKSLYSSLLQGSRASRALSEAMTTVQSTKQLQHPANWAGFVLVGADVKLSNKVALMGQALRDILATPDSCRDALRVTLHLVEKSLQRIHRGYKNAMYTSQKSIETKIGREVAGWKDLLISVGFRFEPAAHGIPPSVFFPQSDPGERLTQCSASLQAILGLSPVSWSALSKLLASPNEDADEIIAMFRQVVTNQQQSEPECMVPVNVRLWRIPGCHELLASLGFDLAEVGSEDVILRTGKAANRRQIQFALQALLALFDTQDAPRCIELDNDDAAELESTESSDGTPGDSLFPAPRNSTAIFDSGHPSAFTSYVRNRGEPDGRQAHDSPPLSGSNGSSSFPQTSIPPPPQIMAMPIYQNNTVVGAGKETSGHAKSGHESDYNFTPSPVIDPSAAAAYRRQQHQHPSPFFSPTIHSHSGPYAYGMSRKSDSSASSLDSLQKSYVPLYENSEMTYSTRQPAGRPVMPIRSVFTDVGYQSTQKITDKSDPNDKFSVRAETGKTLNTLKLSQKYQPQTSQQQDVPDTRLNPGVTRRIPPTGESGSPESTLLPPSNKRSSFAAAETASIATTSSANTFIVKSDDGISAMGAAGTSGVSNAVDLIEESLRGASRRQEGGSGGGARISEVYHESRSVGLGLAPPLSSLIMSSNIKVVQVDHHSDSEGSNSKTSSMQRSSLPATSPVSASSSTHGGAEESFNNIDNLSVIEKAHDRAAVSSAAATPLSPPPTLKQPPPAKRRPPVPPKPSDSWPHPPPHPHASLVPRTRDEGDGRSMTDSQYSGYSPNGQPPLHQHHHHHHGVGGMAGGGQDLTAKMSFLKLNNDVPLPEEADDESGPPDIVSVTPSQLKPKDIADYINKEFRMPKNASSKVAAGASSGSRSSALPANTRHPHQIWSRDKNGGLQYTGMLSSDC